VSDRAYLTLPEVVERYGGALSRWTIYEKVRLGQLPHRKLAGKIVCLPDELDAWEDGAQLEAFQTAAGRVCRPIGGQR
jgi:predicted DNA-binding transcriptional regulator AlpA